MEPPRMIRDDLPADVNRISGAVVEAAFDVHSEYGPGLLESAYVEGLVEEIRRRGLRVMTEVSFPLVYKGKPLRSKYRADLVVEDAVLVEVKVVEALNLVHVAQAQTYLKVTGLPVALLINFNEIHLKHGLRRLVSTTRHRSLRALRDNPPGG